MNIADTILGSFGLVIGGVILIALIIWVVLVFFIPFMIYGISKRMRVMMNYYLAKDGKKVNWWGDLTDAKPLRVRIPERKESTI